MSSPIPTRDYSDMNGNIEPDIDATEEDIDRYMEILEENKDIADDWYPSTQEDTLQDILNENVYGK